LVKHPHACNSPYASSVQRSETGVRLDSVLLRLADQIETEVELRQRIKSAMTYPVVVLAMVTLILSAMLLFVVPQFKDICAQLGGVLPFPTRILLRISDALRHYWYLFFL